MRAIGVLALLAGCQIEATLQRCGDLVCPIDAVCIEDRVCVGPEDARACFGMENGTECSTRKVEVGICGDGMCVTPGCGNGVVEPAEMCDDGNTARDDGCSADCRSNEECGNGLVDFNEECDDGDRVSGDGCSSACRPERLKLTRVERPGPWESGATTMAYAAAWDTLVYFDGARTWFYKAGAWTRGPDGPGSRGEFAMAYDAAREKIVLHGGYRNGAALGDTWELDGTTWTELLGANGPQRLAHTMTYDPVRQKVVMFGGLFSYSGSPTNEVRELAAGTWSVVTTTGTPPLGRYRTPFAFDADRQALVVVGGVRSGSPTDMWQLTPGNAWTQLAASGAPVMSLASLTHDVARQRLVLFDGLGTVWESATTTWTARTDVPLVNDYRPGALAYDTLRDVSVLVGAMESQHWELGTTATRRAHRPGELAGAQLVFDVARRRLVLTGGVRAETWSRAEDGTWTLIAPPEIAQPSTGSMLAYDSVRRRIVAFGDNVGVVETWALDNTTWTLLAGPQPPLRKSTKIVYDAAGDRVVLFGGTDPVTNAQLNDTWVLQGDTWTELEPPARPEPREYPPLAYDAARGRVVLAGGIADGSPLADTWELDGTQWTETEPMPARRGNGVLTYDEVRRRTVLLGGWENGIGGDEDVLDFDGARWSYELSTPEPEFETGTQVAYDVTYDPFAHAVVAIGVAGEDDPWALGYFRWSNDDGVETCSGLDDLDGDELRGCADPDCYGYCDPSCPPRASCVATRPRCGDGMCDSALETHDRCAEDCP